MKSHNFQNTDNEYHFLVLIVNVFLFFGQKIRLFVNMHCVEFGTVWNHVKLKIKVFVLFIAKLTTEKFF